MSETSVTAFPSEPVGKRPVIVWDLVLTIVLLVLMVGAALLASFLSFFLAFASDSCGASVTCDTDRIAGGMLIAMIGPLLVALLVLVAAIIVLVLKRIAFWIPIVGIMLVIGVFAGGAAFTASGVPAATFSVLPSATSGTQGVDPTDPPKATIEHERPT